MALEPALEPLPPDSKRLLELLPGRESDEIKCQIFVAPLDGSQAYEALSYCWGDPFYKTTIACNGSPVAVTRNLYDALQGLRREDAARVLWVDAMCINQNDVKERTDQVAKMQDIYAMAARTVVWLGNEAKNTAEAFVLIDKMLVFRDEIIILSRSQGASSEQETFSLTDKQKEELLSRLPKVNMAEEGATTILQHAQVSRALPGMLPESLNVQGRQACLDLLKRPWFGRAWVVQEVTVASDAIVVCGPYIRQFEDFAQAFALFSKLGLHREVGMKHHQTGLWTTWDTWCKHSYGFNGSILDLLKQHRQRDATDPRDKVYALAGILKASKVRPDMVRNAKTINPHQGNRPLHYDAIPVQPNYYLDTVAVYVSLAKDLISAHTKYDLFGAIHPKRASIFDRLPSWVPDWSISDAYQEFREPAKDLYFRLLTEGEPSAIWEKTGLPDDHAFRLRNGLAPSRRGIYLGYKEAEQWDYVPWFRATLDSSPEPPLFGEGDGWTLTLPGLPFDVIEDIGPVYEGTGPSQHFYDAQRAAVVILPPWESTAEPAYQHTAEGQQYAFVATLTGGHMYMTREEAMRSFTRHMKEMNLQHCLDTAKYGVDLRQSYDNGTLDEEEQGVTEELKATLLSRSSDEWRADRDGFEAELQRLRASGIPTDQIKRCLGVMAHRRFARTKKGYFALIPARADVGDTVALIKGTDVPLVMRKKETNWEMLGEAYVHGIMDGEAYKEGECQSFTII